MPVSYTHLDVYKRQPIQRRSQERLARTDNMTAAQAVLGYGLDPLSRAAPFDSPAVDVAVHDQSRGRIQLAERTALAIGAGEHAPDELSLIHI